MPKIAVKSKPVKPKNALSSMVHVEQTARNKQLRLEKAYKTIGIMRQQHPMGGEIVTIMICGSRGQIMAWRKCRDASSLIQKFQDPVLREKLLATGTEELVETNSWGDRFWGVCDGTGENHLGKLLMAIREELQALYDLGILP